jgi:hypothetical protein
LTGTVGCGSIVVDQSELGKNAFGEQMGQNEMDFDLNIEAMVEGDDQALNDFQDMSAVEQEHDHEPVVPNVATAIELNLNALASMEYESSFEASDGDGHLYEEQGATEEVQIVLALQEAPVNFSIEEVEPHELLSVNPSDDSGSFDAGHGLSGDSDERELGNMQVGMALLPDNLDMDPGLLSLAEQRPMYKKKLADGIRLWAKYFAPPESSPSTPVPAAWQEFFISSLLNPTRLDWARTFLSSEGWNVILKENEKETSISFVLPAKCPIKKIDCVYSNSDQVELAKS